MINKFMSNFHFNFSVTRAIFIKAINVSEALAFLQGANYHILPSDKSNNHAATIRAILSLQYPELPHLQAGPELPR